MTDKSLMEIHESRESAWRLERPEGIYHIWADSGTRVSSSGPARVGEPFWVVAFGNSEMMGWPAQWAASRKQVEADFDAWRKQRTAPRLS
jgi:hypothetical protein